MNSSSKIISAFVTALLSAATWCTSVAADDRVVTILVTGDVGLNRNQQAVHGDHVVSRHGPLAWDRTTTGIDQLIDGDLNMLNLETVVTDRNDLAADTKGQENPYLFRSHPNGVRHLVRTGFNVMSLANNHSMDYGPEGVLETLAHVSTMGADGLLAFAGVGHNRDAAARAVPIALDDATVAFSAIGIVTNNLERHRAGANRIGQVAYRFDDDFVEVTRRLIAEPADYRILSIHYGYEYKLEMDDMQRRDWRNRAVREMGIDLIVGHHAHVVRPVEITDNKVIFYGLGNLLHHGTRDIDGLGLCRDYGLLARVHLLRGDDGALRARAIEAVPITDTHHIPAPYGDAARSHLRIAALNYLARGLDNAEEGARGVRFTPQPDGSGLYCWPGTEADPGRIGDLCRDWAPAADISTDIEAQLERDCGAVRQPTAPAQSEPSGTPDQPAVERPADQSIESLR
jgi:poly-gamma-glutamate synthesis protein (capsule biosynthesis protein)